MSSSRPTISQPDNEPALHSARAGSLLVNPTRGEKLYELCSNVTSSPWPAWSMSALLLGSLPAASRKSSLSAGLPPLWQLAPLAMAFGLAGYITSTGDTNNGSGTTSAWSFIYLFLHAKQSFKHTFIHNSQSKFLCFRLPWMLTTTAALNGGFHGYIYWFGVHPELKNSDGTKVTQRS
ncbi:hypothetical protein CROQUDRAFT_35954 [Cronartium quercuum f. sp. fusiforme G11]|uniref:Uncharacterized protein n=1 Tax=Cronartium quercuum f. sp. fusiforme G11 TaxID=708437 RepID=A0A9P6NTU1_9BASI|nr:hypothetical protein CROQUDRAFT_35954 [Cronartium quercuum f. sp. fusiforme G11]